MTRFIALLVVLIAAVGCTTDQETPPIGSTQQAAAGLPDKAFLPLPKANGVVKWDGSLVDLMAADAFGFCVPWWRTAIQDDQTVETDLYLKHLITLIDSVGTCGAQQSLVPTTWWNQPPFTGETPSRALQWGWRRSQEPTCNIDTRTNGNAVVAGPEMVHAKLVQRWIAYDLLNKLNAPAEYAQQRWIAKREAAHELGLAGMNLCMANRLREQMLSSDPLMTAGSAQRQMLEVIRERAQLALMQFTSLGLAFATTGLGANVPTLGFQSLPALRLFVEATDVSTCVVPGCTPLLKILGSDYARSVQLYIDTTEELAELLARNASARSDLTELGGSISFQSVNDAYENWGDASWRGRFLNLMYGGDPLGTPIQQLATPQNQPKSSFNAVWGRWAGSVFPMRHALTRATSPEVLALLGLARRADAIYLAYDIIGEPEDTAQYIYDAVEAHLRKRACREQNPEAPLSSCIIWADSPEVTQNRGKGELQRLFGISPAHATQLATMLHEVFWNKYNQWEPSTLYFSGKFKWVDDLPQCQAYCSGDAERYLHVDPSFAASDLPEQVLGGRQYLNSGFYLPEGDYAPLVSPRMQGFNQRRMQYNHLFYDVFLNFGVSNASSRYMGAVPVLAAVRDALLRGKKKVDDDLAPQQYGDAYFTLAPEMMKTLEGAIGKVSYSLRPKVVPATMAKAGSIPFACIAGTSNGTSCPAVLQQVNGNLVKAVVTVIRPDTTPSAVKVIALDARTIANLGGSSRQAHEVGYVANVATIDGFTAPEEIDGSPVGLNRGHLNALAGTSPFATTNALNLRRQSFEIEYRFNPGDDTMPDGPLVILLREETTPPRYTVLADGTGLSSADGEGETGAPAAPAVYSADGKYGSIGGSFNIRVAQTWASAAPDFAKPAFDGFGLPSHWIPPTNPELFGGNDGEDSVAFFLRSARSAADEATAAVRYALESVIAEEADTQKLESSKGRSLEIRKLQSKELCGNETGCALDTELYTPKIQITCETDDCNLFKFYLLLSLGAKDPNVAGSNPNYFTFPVLKPVHEALTKDWARPDLLAYAGSEIETLALNQFNAVRKLEDKVASTTLELASLSADKEAARLHAEGLDFEDWIQDGKALARWRLNCSICNTPEPLANDPCCAAPPTPPFQSPGCETAMDMAWKSAFTHPKLENPQSTSELGLFFDLLAPSAFNRGAIAAQEMACREAEIALSHSGINQFQVAAAEAAATAKALGYSAAASGKIGTLLDLAGEVFLAEAEIRKAIKRSGLAQSRVALDAAFEQAGFASQLALYRRYHHYDMWRARALLDDARRLSAAARRAIEGRFVVDLSEMESDEAFVAAPALWADSVYEYDLDAPAAVGLSLTSNTNNDAIYPNKVSDYVKNLENFVRGYSVKRPTATAIGDADVVTLAGPAVGEASSAEGEQSQSGGWLFQCKKDDPWQTNPAVSAPGRAAIDWSFSKNPASDPLDPGPPFDNEGYGPPLGLTVFSGTVNPALAAPGGKAVSFDGTSELFTGASTTVGETSGGITVLTWVNLRSYHAVASNFVMKFRPSSPIWVAVSLGESQAPGGAWDGVIAVANAFKVVSSPPAAAIPLNQWTQVGMTFDGRVQRLYKDGVEVASATVATPDQAPVSIDWGSHGGWSLGKTTNGWIGSTIIDTTAYSAARIAADYKKAISYTAPSIAWQFKNKVMPTGAADGCTNLTRAVCANTYGCGCVADMCAGGSCPMPLDLSVGSEGPMPLDAGGGGAVVAGQPAPSGLPSMDLNGTQYLTTGGTSRGESPSSITLSAWVYVRNAPSATINFLTKEYGAGAYVAPWDAVTLFESGNALKAGVTIAGTLRLATGPSPVPRNQWAHIAMTYEASKIRLFLNGVQQAEFPVPGAPARIDWGAHQEWLIGGHPGQSISLNGMVSDVRVEPRERSAAEITDLYRRGLSDACYFDDDCVGTLSCCAERKEHSPLRTMCDGVPPARAKIAFNLDPWGREGSYYANSPYTERHNVRWGRMAVNLVGVGVRDCSRAPDPTACYAESFLRYDLSHSSPTWVSDYQGNWSAYALPVGQVEGGKALAIEEWVDPIVNGWNQPYVAAVQRNELRERPVDGSYELELEVTPDVQLDRIERLQLLMETNYWVRQR